MRYLVTGGAGFIGSNFVRHLLAERPAVEVTNLDRLTYAGHLENLEGVLDHPRHRFVRGDICDGPLVTELLAGVDVVFNLAAESHVDRSIVSDQPFVRTNVVGTATLLSAARKEQVARFVQVSTDEVYGELPWVDPEGGVEGAVRGEVVGSDDEVDPGGFTEDTPLAPRSPYSATKAAADLLVQSYHTTHDMDVVITRCSNNYGPYQYPEKFIPLMIRNATAGMPLPVYGDGLNVRDWIHVADHCRGLLAAAEQGASGRVYNFGGNAERTNLSLARSLLRMLGKPDSLIEFVEDRAGHDRRYAVDFSRADEELGWRPLRTLDEALEETVEWYRANGEWVEAVMVADR